MHRSSESVAALATALAKAQAELVNPEKSLTAVIRGGRAGEGERTFRYAPLSSGLDIMRKTLGQHEIAIVQATAVDQAAGTINLTTMLAHASGEWIASDWPVCAVAEIASPQRMGAALTYARRYALFTLVGIAGEDDLDAPDLQKAAVPPAAFTSSVPDKFPTSPPTFGNGRSSAVRKPPISLILAPAQSAGLRDRLLGEVANLQSSETAANWASGVLAMKNTLTASDAKIVEDAFEKKIFEFPQPAPAEQLAQAETVGHAPPGASQAGSTADLHDSKQPERIDKSLLAIPEPRRYRSKAHLRFVAEQPCLLCGRKPSDPHHLRFMQPRALARKVSDEFAVPLCRVHHRAVHRTGDEAAWWNDAGLDPIKVARKLWSQTRPSGGRSTHLEPLSRIDADNNPGLP